MLCPPDVRQAEEGGGIEAVHHGYHFLLPVTFPAGRGWAPAQQWTDTWGRLHPVPQGTLPRAAFTSEVRVRRREGLGGWCRGSLSRSPGARMFGRELGG